MTKKLGALTIVVATALLSAVEPAHAGFPGTNGQIAFASNADGDYEIYKINPDGSGLTQLTNDPGEDRDPSWSADGRWLTFVRDGAVWVMDLNGAQQKTVYEFSGNTLRDPVWSPDAGRIAFVDYRSCCVYFLATISASGVRSNLVHNDDSARIEAVDWSADNRVIFSTGGMYVLEPSGAKRLVTSVGGLQPAWSPDSQRIAFVRTSGTPGLWVIDEDGTDPVQLSSGFNDWDPAWSPDGSKIAVRSPAGTGSLDIVVMDADGTNRLPLVATPGDEREPDWQPGPDLSPRGYSRPKQATPLATSIVLAYRPCDEPTREHGPPLAFGSCAPPVEESDYLTVGTADSNGRPTKFLGSLSLTTVRGNPGTSADEADVRVTASLTDIRCKAAQVDPCAGVALADYTGEMMIAVDAQITDRHTPNHFGDTDHQTFDVFYFSIPVGCTATPDTTVGSTCSVETTFDAVTPGLIVEGARTLWQPKVTVLDGGADGWAVSEDNTVFGRQGVFIP